MNKNLLILGLVTPSCLCGSVVAKSQSERPNIIFILTDDQPQSLHRYAGNEYIQTPNLDRLAEEGAVHFLDHRPDDKPFFMNLCFNLPHNSSTSAMKQRESDPDTYRSLYRDLYIPLPKDYIAKADIKEPKLPESVHHAADRQSTYDYVNTPEQCKESSENYLSINGWINVDLDVVGKGAVELELRDAKGEMIAQKSVAVGAKRSIG